MAGIAAAVGGGALLSYLGSQNAAGAAQSAANTQANAANQATQAQLSMFNTQQANQAPYLQAGYSGLSQLQSALPSLTKNFSASDFTQDPGYQFNLNQGMEALDRSAGARGYSGGTLKALTNYVQGTASNEYQNAYNRYTNNQNNTFSKLSGLANYGQSANSQGLSNSQSTASNIGSNITGAGNAQAAGTIGAANAQNAGLGSIANAGLNYATLSSLQSPASTGSAAYSSPYAQSGSSPYSGYLGNYNLEVP
jgi:hypothetical protein